MSKIEMGGDDVQALQHERHAFLRRQEAFLSILKGHGTDAALEEWDAAEAEWQEAKSVCDKIVEEVRSGARLF
jgi:hypothetical protein